MSDPTPGGAGLPEPGLPEPVLSEPVVPEPVVPVPVVPAEPAPAQAVPGQAAAAGADETVRVPAGPEVAWRAPEPPRAMPWQAPAAAVPPGEPLPPGPPVDGWTTGAPAAGAPQPTGVLSAATVGWVTPPPQPPPTGNPGWIVASVGVRFGAWFIDGFIVGFLSIVTIGILAAIARPGPGQDSALTVAYVVVIVGLYFVYFVGLWTSGGKATIGMRIFRLQVANAIDGKRLTIRAATVRWLGLGYFLDGLIFLPFAGLAALVWDIVLLITTSNHAMHQGIHDRWAGSVVVRPEGTGTGGGWLTACLVVIVLILLIGLISIVGLIFVGSQISVILSRVGSSI